jgi:hypothetical protein
VSSKAGILVSAALVSGALSASSLMSVSSAGPTPRDLLRQLAQFSDSDWTSVERGEAVAKALDTDPRHIAIVGAVRIRGSPEQLIRRYRDVERLERSALVIDVGRFSIPPVPADLLEAPFEEYSLDLRSCRSGECRVRLSAADISRFHSDVNWDARDWRSQSASLWRQVLAARTAEYLARGRHGLPDYMNKADALRVPSELSLLLAEFRFVAAYSPEFHGYMQNFGPDAPAGAEHTVYWTKEDFGVRPIFRISHQVVYRVPAGGVTLIATNQIYADHYLDAALSLALAVDAASGRGEEFYMIAINRARTRSLSGLLRRFARSAVQNRSRDAMRRILTGTKSSVEAEVQH